MPVLNLQPFANVGNSQSALKLEFLQNLCLDLTPNLEAFISFLFLFISEMDLLRAVKSVRAGRSVSWVTSISWVFV